MKRSLKLVGFCFFIVLLLNSVMKEAIAQSGVKITPKHLDISGILGSSPFQHNFKVQAVTQDINELAFSPGNLMEIYEGKSWITGVNVLISPTIKSIKKGQSKDFVITVQNIPQSGQYDGTITLTYKGQTAEAQDALLISVRAVKFSPVPPQVMLRFEKSLFGFGGKDKIPWTLALNEDIGYAPMEIINSTFKTESIKIAPLVHSEDKSQIIRPEDILLQPTPEERSTNQGLEIKMTFSNPNVGAGKYSGNLTVRSKDFGFLATVPVEVYVRHSSWLAWLLIFTGIIVSLMVNKWNTTGKKKNAIKGEVWNLRDKLKSANITKICHREIENQLNEVLILLNDAKLKEAQDKVTEMITRLETCKGEKKELEGKAAEVQELIRRLAQLQKRVKVIANLNDALLKSYLPDIKKKLEMLKSKIENEVYSSVDDTLKQRVLDLKGRVDAFTDPAPKGLLDGLAELEEDLGRYEQAYQGALELYFIHPIKAHLSTIAREKDVADVAQEIKEAGDKFKVVAYILKKLSIFNDQIESGHHNGLDMSKAEQELKKCQRYLADGNIEMANGHLDDIKKIIGEAVRENVTKVASASSHFLSKFANAFSIEEMANVLSKDLDSENLNEEDERHVIAVKSLVERLGIESELPSQIKEPEKPPESPPASPSKDGGFRQWWGQWWTPEQEERTISILIFLVVIPLLAVIGYSQLYVDNLTFGDKNVWEAYLGLFLWGFGIQTGTATVAGVLKTFSGS